MKIKSEKKFTVKALGNDYPFAKKPPQLSLGAAPQSQVHALLAAQLQLLQAQHQAAAGIGVAHPGVMDQSSPALHFLNGGGPHLDPYTAQLMAASAANPSLMSSLMPFTFAQPSSTTTSLTSTAPTGTSESIYTNGASTSDGSCAPASTSEYAAQLPGANPLHHSTASPQHPLFSQSAAESLIRGMPPPPSATGATPTASTLSRLVAPTPPGPTGALLNATGLSELGLPGTGSGFAALYGHPAGAAGAMSSLLGPTANPMALNFLLNQAGQGSLAAQKHLLAGAAGALCGIGGPKRVNGPQIVRSKLLEEVRTGAFPHLGIRDFKGHILEFAKDQQGSRIIQQKLEQRTPEDIRIVFQELEAESVSLMTDVFGNYVIQKLFEFGTKEQRGMLADRMKGHLLNLSLHMYGCRVVQRALETMPREHQRNFINELQANAQRIIKDQNGNHVIQKCVEKVHPDDIQPLLDALMGSILPLSTHPFGCRVIQRILEHCTAVQIAPIMDEVLLGGERLVKDQYGNYVAQHVLEHGHPNNKSQVVEIVRGKLATLAKHKFASNVLEKVIQYCSPSERASLIEEACSDPEALVSMMKDQYANYVLQKMLDVSGSSEKRMLLMSMKPHLPETAKFTYGKHITNKVEKLLGLQQAEDKPAVA